MLINKFIYHLSFGTANQSENQKGSQFASP